MKNKKVRKVRQVKIDHRSKMKNLQKWIITQYVKVTEKSQQTTAKTLGKTEDKTVILFLCVCSYTCVTLCMQCAYT